MGPEKYPVPKQNKTVYSREAFEKTEEGIKNAEFVMEDAPKGALGGLRGRTGFNDPGDFAAAHFDRMALQQEQGRLLERAHEEALQEDKERATPKILDSLIENKTGLAIKTKSGNIYEIQRIGDEVYTHLVRENQYYKAPIEAWQEMSLPEVGDLNIGNFGTSGVISVEVRPLGAQGNTEAVVETDVVEENLENIYRVEDLETSATESAHNPEAEAAEQLEKHNRWCEINGLDPQENEFYHWHNLGDVRGIAGKFKGRTFSITIYSDSNTREVFIDGVDAHIREQPLFKQFVDQLYESFKPFVAYEMPRGQDRPSNIRWNDGPRRSSDRANIFGTIATLAAPVENIKFSDVQEKPDFLD